MRFNKSIYFICLIAIGNYSCEKQDKFLDAKPNDALTTITTLEDCQSLLQNEGIFNSNDPAIGSLSADEYYVTDDVWANAGTNLERKLYIWSNQVYNAGETVPDWNENYTKIYYANVILDALPRIEVLPSQQNLYNQIKGSALFFRANTFYNLVQLFAMPYDSATASTQLGIPLRLSSDLNIKSVRASEKDCYDQILNDLKAAEQLLPSSSLYKTLPTKLSVKSLLARIYLAIGSYDNAFQYADAALSINNVLTNYNLLPASGSRFTTASTPYLDEDLFHSTMTGYSFLTFSGGIVDSMLYQSYESNDLRKNLFFAFRNDGIRFKGSYEFHWFGIFFSGLATDEMYLIRAECYSRQGNVIAAMIDLNALLVKRYLDGTYIDRSAINADDALRQIIKERQKELCFRGIRWTDLRRLNKDSRFAVTLKRIVNGQTYTLPPTDLRYALPIPDNEIALSGIPQNPR